MKSIAKAILFGSFILAGQAAMADGPAFVYRSDGIYLPTHVTYADQHAGDRTSSAPETYPTSMDETGIFLPAHVTYADEHANDRVSNVASAFPTETDETGIFLPARSTFADSNLDRPMQATRPGPDSGSGAD